jgi:hypothetical protein
MPENLHASPSFGDGLCHSRAPGPEQKSHPLSLLLYSSTGVAGTQSAMARLFRVTLAAVATLILQTHARPTGPPPDPFADPKNDPWNPLRYIPNDILTGIAVGT